MTTDIPNTSNAILDARRDWYDGRGCVFKYGDLYSHRPLIDSSGLYVRVSWDRDYIDTYNNEMRVLLAANEPPDWAPGTRLPDSQQSAELLLSGNSLTEFHPANKKEERLVQTRVSGWKAEHLKPPEKFVRVPEKRLILLGGNTGTGFRIDVLDLQTHVWMYTYE
jgi:hypothetical protein